jgi:hypothetical protein
MMLKMPKIGFKSVTITDITYQIAQRQANQDGTSITEVISKALVAYINKRLDIEDKQRTAFKIIQETEKNEPKV